jgi:hypothetical protein
MNERDSSGSNGNGKDESGGRLRPEDEILLANLERITEASGKRLMMVLVVERGPAIKLGGPPVPMVSHLIPKGINDHTAIAALCGLLSRILARDVVPANVGAIMQAMAAKYGANAPMPPMPGKMELLP